MSEPRRAPARAAAQRWSGPGAWAAQAVLLAAVVGLIAWLASNALGNMEARGLTSGFDFLTRPAGFDISQHLVNYSPSDTYGRVFLVGALNTLLVSVLAIITATIIGLVVGTARMSRNWLARTIARTYVDIVRNIPLTIQILVWFSVMILAPTPRHAWHAGGVAVLSNRGLYLPKPLWNNSGWIALTAAATSIVVGLVLAHLFNRRRAEVGHAPSPAWGWGVAVVGTILSLVITGNPSGVELPKFGGFDFNGGLSLSPSLTALWAALSVYTAGFIAEIVRAGIAAVSVGQGEAARSLGLTEGQTLRLVVLPQALRVIVPPLASQYLNATKNSSLAVIIGYPDLVALFGGTVLNQTGQSIETLSLVMAFYLTVSLSISALMNLWNARTAAWAAPR